MSHEARNLVSGIVGTLDVAHEAQHPLDLGQMAQLLRGNARALQDLLDASLDASQIDAGRFSVQASAVDVVALLEALARERMPTTARTRQSPTVHVNFARGSLWMVDGVRLSQIVRNLLSNAIKYAGTGEIRVCAETVCDPAWPALTRLNVRVKDTGPGLSANQCRRLFADFERVGDDLQAAGVGLGLSISRRLARAMGGDLSVTSEPGSGCCFMVNLPVAPVFAGPLQTGLPTPAITVGSHDERCPCS